MNETYVHGYDSRANARLQDQADTLVDLLHGDTASPAGSWVLEAFARPFGALAIRKTLRRPGGTITVIDGVFCYTFFKGVGVKRRLA